MIAPVSVDVSSLDSYVLWSVTDKLHDAGGSVWEHLYVWSQQAIVLKTQRFLKSSRRLTYSNNKV